MVRPRKKGSGCGGAIWMAPATALLFVWMAVPLGLTLWFSMLHYNLLDAGSRHYVGIANLSNLLREPTLWTAVAHSLSVVFLVLAVTIGLGLLIAVLFDQQFRGRPVALVIFISPVFVMPTVSALVWKNMLMHPVNGVFAFLTRSVGLGAIDWFGSWPLTSIVVILSWEWMPFAFLIFLASLQALPRSQRDAAIMDGAGRVGYFRFIALPHLRRSIAIVVMLETVLMLAIFAEIFVTTAGGPGLATTTLTFLIYLRALLQFDVGQAAAASVIAVMLANCVMIPLAVTVGRALDARN
jgi:sorbitol/mannitol transport system permease protein